MPAEPTCLFCRIVSKAIPASVVFEDDRVVAFLDIQPVNFGHLLVVPREHHRDLLALPADLASAMASLLPALARAIVKATGAAGLNLVANNGEVAGQTIHHAHWHLIPRFDGDKVQWPWPHLAYRDGQVEEVRAQIRQAHAEDHGVEIDAGTA